MLRLKTCSKVAEVDEGQRVDGAQTRSVYEHTRGVERRRDAGLLYLSRLWDTFLPARLSHARDQTICGHFAEGDTRKLEAA